MRKNLRLFILTLLTFTGCTAAISSLSAQADNQGWKADHESQKVFIENKGQWQGTNNLPGSKILYATDYGPTQILFTKSGLTYRLEKTAPRNKEKEEEMEAPLKKGLSHEEVEELKSQLSTIHELDFIQMQWIGANPNVEVISLSAVPQYFNFGLGQKSIEHVNGYQKLLYKNLYNNIDVEYVFHPKGGIEYSFILHPGADASVIKMKSNSDAVTIDIDNNIHYATKFGDIIEHAPQTFYQDSREAKIASYFIRNGKTISFSLGNYDKTKTVVIDPWVQAPTFATGWQCVWECQKDGAGNVYIIGGVMPMQLLKYNSIGTLQWTYSTPYDTANSWLGTFATDFSGNSYVTQGSIAAIQKINTAGGLVWNNGGPGGIFTLTEFWSISFNSDQTKLVIGGTGGSLSPLPFIYQVDMNSGNVLTSAQITGGGISPPQEVRSITGGDNGKFYFLTHDSIGYINQNLGSVCANPGQAKYYIKQNFHLGYKCENFRVNNTGICALRYKSGFVYVNRGDTLEKRDASTGNVLAAVAIPGGAFTTQTFLGMTTSYVNNSGIDVDSCGNIYVGAINQVVKFNTSLNQLAIYPTAFNVYDVQVSYNGVLIACGSTGNSSSGARSGSIQSFNAGACSPVPITNCDASVCHIGPFCDTSLPVTITPSTVGGTWSGTGVSGTGVFTPATAGVGTHYVTYSLACGSDSMAVVVNHCANMQACIDSGGRVTVSHGVGPYTWYQQQTVCTSCIIGCIFPPGCAVTSWQSFATGTTITPPSYPIRIDDNSGNFLGIDSASTLSPCTTSSCTLAAAATPISTTCGNNNGTATVTATGGTPTSYSWSNGGNTASISNLSPGTYRVTITSIGSCSATASTTISGSSAVTIASVPTATTCGNNNGSATVNVTAGNAPFTYAWSNSMSTQTITNVAAATYTVTVTGAGNCTASASATIASSTGLTFNTSTTNASCNTGGSATANITAGSAPFTYAWSNNATTSFISNVAGGTYTVTVTSLGGCSASASAVIGTSGGAVALQPSFSNANCGNNNGIAAVTVTAGTAPYTYSWSGSAATTDTITGLGAGTYTVTVTGTGNCTATLSITVTSTAAVTLTASGTNAGCSPTGTASVNVNTGTAPYTYAWSNAGTTSTISNLSAGTYRVTVTGAGGCSATASTVITAPGGLSLTPTSTGTTCGGATGTASVAATGGTTYTYSWSNTGTTATISNLTAGTYSVTVIANTGCSATASIAVAPSGGTGTTVATTNIPVMCSSDSAHVCALPGFVTYLWNNGKTTQCIYVHSAGNYYVTVTDSAGCTYVSNHVAVSVHPQPPVTISVNGDTLIAYNAVTYQWYFNGNIIPGATSHMLIAQQTGNYSVAVTDTNGCLTISSKATVLLGINNVSADGRVSVYPNPLAQGSWNLAVTEDWIGGNCEVYDAGGKLVYKSEIRSLRSEISLNVAGGIYMMRVFTEKNTVTIKLIKL